ncbi:MAG: hypothetical protein R2695_01325 [Acidimicrobiales bacterium]
MTERDRLGAPWRSPGWSSSPVAFDAVAAELARYPNADEIVWLQEEPENMGPWNAIKGRLYERHEETHRIRRVSRFESGSPACGSTRARPGSTASSGRALTF